MILVFPILSIVAVVLTGSFLLRVGFPLYRERKAVSVFALAAGFIAYIVAALGTRIVGISGHNIIGAGLSSGTDLDRWVLQRQAVSTAVLVYMTVLVRRDLATPSQARSLLKESLPMVALALFLAGLELVQNT